MASSDPLFLASVLSTVAVGALGAQVFGLDAPSRETNGCGLLRCCSDLMAACGGHGGGGEGACEDGSAAARLNLAMAVVAARSSVEGWGWLASLESSSLRRAIVAETGLGRWRRAGRG